MIRRTTLHGPEIPRDSAINEPITPYEKGVKFLCPNCGKAEIWRSWRARKMGIVYRCPVCGFEGP